MCENILHLIVYNVLQHPDTGDMLLFLVLIICCFVLRLVVFGRVRVLGTEIFFNMFERNSGLFSRRMEIWYYVNRNSTKILKFSATVNTYLSTYQMLTFEVHLLSLDFVHPTSCKDTIEILINNVPSYRGDKEDSKKSKCLFKVKLGA